MNLRSEGANPRALGTNPRAVGNQIPKAKLPAVVITNTEELKAFLERTKRPKRGRGKKKAAIKHDWQTALKYVAAVTAVTNEGN
jgi:hypothetical protein